jgi:hypothetical protein
MRFPACCGTHGRKVSAGTGSAAALALQSRVQFMVLGGGRCDRTTYVRAMGQNVSAYLREWMVDAKGVDAFELSLASTLLVTLS